jgi:branched-chain amino acid transport system ATP-binding protein
MALALKVSGLRMRFGANWALNGVDLSVPAGELRAVIGPNGAGKSTLFGVIAGEHTPSSGAVELDGRDVTGVPPHTRVRLGLVRTFQVTRIFPGLTVHENVLAAVLARRRRGHVCWRPAGGEERGRADDWLRLVGLGALASRPARALSQGDRKRLEVATALALEPRLLLLDEPTAGMSPEETEATVRLLERVWEELRPTVLLTEHDVALVMRLAQRVTVLHRGAVVCTGTAGEVQRRGDVREIYLGHG